MNRRLTYWHVLAWMFFSMMPIKMVSAQSTFTSSELDSWVEPYIKQSLKEFIEFLSLPNDAFRTAELEPNIEWLESAFASRGFSTTRLPTAGIDLLLAERKASPQDPTLLVYLQVDGQPVDPTRWQQPTPYTPTLKIPFDDTEYESRDLSLLDGEIDPEWRIFARSASDAKGPINMFLTALDIMNDRELSIPYNLKVIMDTEEELGSPNLPDAVNQHREALAADWLIIYDGPRHTSNRPTLKYGARGIATMRLTTYGPRVPLHSGHYGNYAPNPALLLSQLLASMKDESGRVTIPGFYDGIDIDRQTAMLLKQVPDDETAIQEQLGFSHPDAVGTSLQEAIQYPSLNIRGMSSGWVGSKVRTIIPDAAVANLDIRLVLESDPERLIRLIIDHIRKQGFLIVDGEPSNEQRKSSGKICSIHSNISYQAFRTDMFSPIGTWLVGCMRQAFGSTPVQIRTTGGSVPISPFVNTLKVPAVVIPLVNHDNNQHSPNENVRIGNYIEGIKTCLSVLLTPMPLSK